jgi:DNA-binding CsgD family transcriptional regulator
MAYRVQAEKEKCWELKQQGIGATEIAKRLNIHRTTVYQLWKSVEKEQEKSVAA